MNILAELNGITKRYGPDGEGTGRPVLDNLSLTVASGDSIAITGPSGSGKSTLLNILGTLDKPTKGRVVLDGLDTGSADEATLAGLRNRFTGFVFQLHYLLPQLTLSENILLPAVPLKNRAERKAAEERARQLADLVGLSAILHRFPWQASVGECQRAALVRALVNGPKLLLADEPTGSLDEENALRMGQILQEINRREQVAIVLVTHSEALAALMKTRYRLTSGTLHRLP